MIGMVVLSIGVGLGFLGIVLGMVLQIARWLEALGGQPTSLLAKIRLGLRAIEQQTQPLRSRWYRVQHRMEDLRRRLEELEKAITGEGR